ncbi:MAG: 6-pyruvoyl trahydropterin synthase family protein [Caulobacterales bacterium]
MPALLFTRRYAMAHRLITDPHSKCATPHGHNEFVTVRLEPTSQFRFSNVNCLTSFEAAKHRWHAWIDDHVDHALQLNAADPLIDWFAAHEPQRLQRIMTMPGDPTTEALAACFFLKMSAFLEAERLPYRVSSLKVEETPTNAVEVTRDGFDPETCGLCLDHWARRPDMSLNDFG